MILSILERSKCIYSINKSFLFIFISSIVFIDVFLSLAAIIILPLIFAKLLVTSLPIPLLPPVIKITFPERSATTWQTVPFILRLIKYAIPLAIEKITEREKIFLLLKISSI